MGFPGEVPWLDHLWDRLIEHPARAFRVWLVGGNVNAVIPIPVPVTDNGGSLTVDGAVTIPVPVPVTDNAGVLTVDIDHTTPGTTDRVETRANVRRPASTLHRNAIAAADKVAAGGVVTLSGQICGGTLVPATTYYVTICPRNAYGPSAPSAIVSAAPGGANNGLRAAWASVTGALWYDLFLSIDAQPKHVGSCTEAQRLAGGVLLAENGAIGAGGAANSIDIGVVGTALAPNVAPYTFNNAYIPVGPAVIDCRGYSKAHVQASLSVTDLRSLPSLTLVPFLQADTNAFYQCEARDMLALTATGYSLNQDIVITVDGAQGLVVLVGTITGAGATATVRVELA